MTAVTFFSWRRPLTVEDPPAERAGLAGSCTVPTRFCWRVRAHPRVVGWLGRCGRTPRPIVPPAPPPGWRCRPGAGGSNNGGSICHVISHPLPQTTEAACRAVTRVVRLQCVVGVCVCASSRYRMAWCTRLGAATLVPNTHHVAAELARALRVATRQVTGGYSRFRF